MGLKTGSAALAAAMLSAAPVCAADIVLTVDGVRAEGGNVLVSLQTEAQFMGQDYVTGAMLPGNAAGALTARLTDVPPGDYALSVLHDADGNQTMTMAAGGGIAEGWGMSGDLPGDRVPTFADARITVPEDGTEVTVTMMYPD